MTAATEDTQDDIPPVTVEDHDHGPDADHDHEPWIRLSDARAQAAAFARGFLPAEPDQEDCETCRVIKLIAAGFESSGDGQV